MFSNLKNLSYANWSNTCRFCFSTKNLVPIFETSNLVARIKNILQIKISAKDNLPNKICGYCVNKLETTTDTVENIINSTEKIRGYVHFLELNLCEDEEDFKPKVNLVNTKPQVWVYLKYLCYDNWHNICRFCFCPQNLYDLYNSTEYTDKINYLTGLKISTTQKLPDKICSECQNKIQAAYSFAFDCFLAVKKLHQYLVLIDIGVDYSEDDEVNSEPVKPETVHDEGKGCDENCGCVPKHCLKQNPQIK